jgi:hypothetical protein
LRDSQNGLGRRNLRTVTRFGNLGRVLYGGQSELLNQAARLSVFYEDLRLEIGEFRKLEATHQQSGAIGIEYETMYYLRRSLATLVEFGSGLNCCSASPEFKSVQAQLSFLQKKHIFEADRFLQGNWSTLTGMRNAFGGHIDMKAVTFATTSKLDGKDLASEFRSASKMMAKGLKHVQLATCAMISAFS